jgi:hypothetical protein
MSETGRALWEKAYDRKGFLAISSATAFLAACGIRSGGGQGVPVSGGEDRLGAP